MIFLELQQILVNWFDSTGSESSWASPKSQNTWFSDFSFAVTDPF